MSRLHVVRVGAMGAVGNFAAADADLYPRNMRVIVRTARGMEIGEVLAAPDEVGTPLDADGTILRSMTVEDRLLESRLNKNCHAAYEACQQRLTERGLHACLMDVEHLFDGRSLIFYFLGHVPEEVEDLTTELADVYEANVKFQAFVDTVTEGCGPGCGTEDAQASGCGSCSTGCAVADACGTRRRTGS